MLYKYGMRLRGFAPMCQPMNGFNHREDDPTKEYHDILVYNRPLTAKEMSDYELDNLNFKTYRITYEIVLDIVAENAEEAEEIANDMIASGEFTESHISTEEI